ncbi:hypothetical protein GY45DRAFT_57364 [Cubamyces sp. BRFM 1775]|nr:hypothetical protein GY45DRAFT_57364 [Cubamyces sp. BRFM 1775]
MKADQRDCMCAYLCMPLFTSRSHNRPRNPTHRPIVADYGCKKCITSDSNLNRSTIPVLRCWTHAVAVDTPRSTEHSRQRWDVSSLFVLPADVKSSERQHGISIAHMKVFHCASNRPRREPYMHSHTAQAIYGLQHIAVSSRCQKTSRFVFRRHVHRQPLGTASPEAVTRLLSFLP